MSGNRIWVLGTAIVAVAILLLGWFVGVSPKLSEAQLALDAKQDVDAQNTAQEASLNVLRAQHDDLEDLKSELTKLRTEIPESEELERFLDQIVLAATATNVSVLKVTNEEAIAYSAAPIEPGTEVETTEPGEATAATPVDGSDAEASVLSPSATLSPIFFTVNVTIELGGDGPSIFAFSKLLQTGKRLFLVPNIVFDSKATGETPAGIIHGILYVVRDPAAFAAAAAEAAAEEEAKPKPTATPTPTPTQTPSG